MSNPIHPPSSILSLSPPCSPASKKNLALASVILAQRQTPGRGYGAPPPVQPEYNPRPVTTDGRLGQGQQQQHDHQGLDWLLESVPGQPGTDYPIFSQDQLAGFRFDCGGQVEGGEGQTCPLS